MVGYILSTQAKVTPPPQTNNQGIKDRLKMEKEDKSFLLEIGTKDNSVLLILPTGPQTAPAVSQGDGGGAISIVTAMR